MEVRLGDALVCVRRRLRDVGQGPDRFREALQPHLRSVLGENVPPTNLTYELFLDEAGQKISKSKGNGLSVDDWLKYAPPESLALYMYQKPKTAKRLFFDVIPKNVDEYLDFLGKVPGRSRRCQAQ